MSSLSPWLIVGLGNPGPKYADNRHNVGFMVVERWAEHHATPGTGGPGWKQQFKGRAAVVHAGAGIGRAVVLQPHTFMNLSGQSVRAAADFYDIPLDRIVVVHDEIDFEFGRVALKRGGGHGGHNGLRNIIEHLEKPRFLRVRVGVDRPRHGEVADWVLSDFRGQDALHLGELIDRAEQALTVLVAEGLTLASNKFNQSPPPETASSPSSAS